MTTTLAITSGQTHFFAQGYDILPSPGTAVPDTVAQAIIGQASQAGVVLSSSAGTGVVNVPSRRFTRSGVGPPQAGEGRWLLGDEIVDSTSAQFECSVPGDPGTWVAQPVNGTFVPVLNVGLLGWAQAQAYQLASGTRDGNGALTSGSVVWPDGSTGTFTADTVSVAFPGAIDAYHITYVPASGSTKTVTQTAVTRDPSTGAVTAQPALTVA